MSIREKKEKKGKKRRKKLSFTVHGNPASSSFLQSRKFCLFIFWKSFKSETNEFFASQSRLSFLECIRDSRAHSKKDIRI